MKSIFVLITLLISTESVLASGSINTIENEHPKFTSGIEVYFTPSLDCENNIIKRINNANKIDIAVYSINNANIFNALLNAKDCGANIHIVTDKLQAKGKYSLVYDLIDAGFNIRLNKKTKIEHNKFAVFDDKSIVTGSYNWTNAASNYNSENCVFFEQSNKEFSNRFNYLWNLYEP